jgi:porin
MLGRRLIYSLFFAAIICATLCAGLLSPEIAAAQEATPSPPGAAQTQPPPPTTLTGDWGGLRTKLHDMGVDITAGYKEEATGNTYGDIPKQWAQAGEFDVGATLDAQKLWGVYGGVLQTTVTIRQGQPPPGDLLQQSIEVYGRGNIARLTEFWYRQKLFNDKLTIKFGRMPQGDFNNFSCDFVNLTFCGAPGGNIVGNYWFNWPIAQWAALARYDFGEYDVGAGVYEINPQDLDLQFSPGWFCCATGAMGHFELGWTPEFGPQKLVGHYQIGVWDSTAGGSDVLLGVNGQPYALTGLPPLHQPNAYGFYVQGQQQITGSATYNRDSGWRNNHGLSVFFNFIQADRATATLDNQFSVGLTFAGLMPSRPGDTAGLAFGRTGYNSRAAESILLATPGVQVPQAEYPIEAFYSFQATPWWDVRPDFQYVIHPGGYVKASNEALIGLRTDITF